MSNLNLPNMSRENLLAILGTRYNKKIAHNTMAEKMPGGVRVRYHGNTIAELTENRDWIGNAGWSTVTTSQRLNRIAQDNNLPIVLAIRQGVMVSLDPDTLKPNESFFSASWFDGKRQH